MDIAIRSKLVFCLLTTLTALSWAQPTAVPVSDLQAQLWAASCMACHGTDGKAEGTGLSLHGQSVAELYTALLAYKNGGRTGTIMQKHAKGYTDTELRRIAEVLGTSR
jgi:cytochrome c553